MKNRDIPLAVLRNIFSEIGPIGIDSSAVIHANHIQLSYLRSLLRRIWTGRNIALHYFRQQTHEIACLRRVSVFFHKFCIVSLYDFGHTKPTNYMVQRATSTLPSVLSSSTFSCSLSTPCKIPVPLHSHNQPLNAILFRRSPPHPIIFPIPLLPHQLATNTQKHSNLAP